MEQVPQQPVQTPVALTDPVSVPEPARGTPVYSLRKPFFIIAISLSIVFASVLILTMNRVRTEKPPVLTSATPIPTPTVSRILSSLATQSAFLRLENTIASLSSQLNNYVVDDPSLSPPALDLPLGFSR